MWSCLLKNVERLYYLCSDICRQQGLHGRPLSWWYYPGYRWHLHQQHDALWSSDSHKAGHTTAQLNRPEVRGHATLCFREINQSVDQLYLFFCYRPETKLWTPRVREDGRAHPFKMNLEAERQVSAMLITTYTVYVLALLSMHCATMVSVFRFLR